MKPTLLLAILCASASAYVLPSRLVRPAGLACSKSSRWPLRMQEEGAAEEAAPEAVPAPKASRDSPAPAPKASRDSPLAGVFSEADLEEQKTSKQMTDEEREALRGKTQIIIPAAAITFLAIAQLAGGPDAVKNFEAKMGDPLANAPGMEQARKMTEEQDARKAEKVAGLKKVIVEGAPGVSE